MTDNSITITNDNSTLMNNTSTINVYPSGYTVPEIVIASILVIIVMIVVIVGNMLVIIAISTEKTLKNIQNWFIASLAVADFSLGLIIMPFSLANELMGYWVFGNWWCDIHSALDVLLCTASIMNLCLISLDRYWSITQAVDYLKKRTPSRAIFMITAVWILSAIICIPPLLGWKVDRTRNPNEKFPKCQLSEELGYVLYSALGSFYVPSCIMVFVYIRIYYAAKKRARRGIRKPNRNPVPQKVNTCNNVIELPNCTRNNINNMNNNNNHNQIATIQSSNCRHPIAVPIPIVTCDFASDASTCSDVAIEYNHQCEYALKHTLEVKTKENPEVYTTSLICPNQEVSNKLKSRQLSAIEISEFEPSSSDSGIVSRCTNIKPLKSRFSKQLFCYGSKKRPKQTTQSKATTDCTELVVDKSTQSTQLVQGQIEKAEQKRDPEREKRRIARKKEKRATLILGLIMGAFIACWLPFFTMYILRLVVYLPNFAFSAAFWLGYLNSALNPVIYTIFNKDFRRAFRHILFK